MGEEEQVKSMEIVYDKFKLVPTQSGTRFDLMEKVTRKKKDKKGNTTGEKYEDWKMHGYDMTFESALLTIAMVSVNRKKDKKQLTPEEYIKAFRQEKRKLLKSFDQ